MPSKCSAEGLAEIAGHEGIVTSPYYDSVRVLTFGVGHTAAAGYPAPHSLPMGKAQPISLAMDVFAQDIARVEARVRKAFTRPLEQHQFDSACSFDLNTGGILTATWVAKFNAGDLAGAKRAFLNWSKPKEIIPRRQKERALFFDGTYSNGGYATVYPADAKGNVLWGQGKRVKVTSLTPKPEAAPAPQEPAQNAQEPVPAPQTPAKPETPSTGKTAATAGALVIIAGAAAAFWHQIVHFFHYLGSFF